MARFGIRLVMAIGLLAVPAVVSAQVQFYNGDPDVHTTHLQAGSEHNTEVPHSMVYDNFVVSGGGVTVTDLFGHFVGSDDAAAWTTAQWEIRSGISAGNGGTLLFSGESAATRTATLFTSANSEVYLAAISGLNLFLGAGTYWMGISPVGSGSGRYFTLSASGINGVNALIDGESYIDSDHWGHSYDRFPDLGFPADFAYGFEGELGATSTVPEPATMTLLASGLAAIAATRRRRQ